MVLQLRIQHLLSVLVKANNIIKKKNQLVCHLPLEFITLACIVSFVSGIAGPTSLKRHLYI